MPPKRGGLQTALSHNGILHCCWEGQLALRPVSVCPCPSVPLEKDNSEEFRQREARAAQLAREIESSPQYRLRIAMENDDGRTEEEKHSSVQRQVSGRDSPILASR